MVLSREVPTFFLDTPCCSFYCKIITINLLKNKCEARAPWKQKYPPAHSLNRLQGWEERLCFVANEKELWVWDFLLLICEVLVLKSQKENSVYTKLQSFRCLTVVILLWSVWKPYSKSLPSFFTGSHPLTENTRTLQWPSWALHRGNREISVRTFTLCFEHPIPGQCRACNSESILVDVIFLRAVLLILGGIAFAYIFVRFLLFRSCPQKVKNRSWGKGEAEMSFSLPISMNCEL